MLSRLTIFVAAFGLAFGLVVGMSAIERRVSMRRRYRKISRHQGTGKGREDTLRPSRGGNLPRARDAESAALMKAARFAQIAIGVGDAMYVQGEHSVAYAVFFGTIHCVSRAEFAFLVGRWAPTLREAEAALESNPKDAAWLLRGALREFVEDVDDDYAPLLELDPRT